MTWQAAQDWEQHWWGNCVNTFGEEYKQLLYADKMGLQTFHNGKSPFNFDLSGKSVLDIGGGPASLLLKCVDVKGKVVDPLEFPAWVPLRYQAAGIEFERVRGEDIDEAGWDECWIYNVLQHVQNPAKIITNAQRAGRLIRIFEWIDMAMSSTHPQELTEKKLNLWLCGEGKVELINQNECVGKAYYGIFPSHKGIRQ